MFEETKLLALPCYQSMEKIIVLSTLPTSGIFTITFSPFCTWRDCFSVLCAHVTGDVTYVNCIFFVFSFLVKIVRARAHFHVKVMLLINYFYRLFLFLYIFLEPRLVLQSHFDEPQNYFTAAAF